MYLKYKNKKVEEICNNKKLATRKIGDKCAEILMRRITQLEAFENLSLVPSEKPFRRHSLSGDLKGFFAVNIDGQFRIIFKPEFEDNIDDNDLSILKSITIITIEEVSKHYGD